MAREYQNPSNFAHGTHDVQKALEEWVEAIRNSQTDRTSAGESRVTRAEEKIRDMVTYYALE